MKLPDILIVEDEVLIADDIMELCKLNGYVVKGVALNAGQALNMLEGSKPDLVLLDINLTDEVSGFEIAERLENKEEIPYIFITSYTDEDTLDKVAALSPLGFIVKPFNKHQLLASLDLAWQKHMQKKDLDLLKKLDKIGVELTNREYDVVEKSLKT